MHITEYKTEYKMHKTDIKNDVSTLWKQQHLSNHFYIHKFSKMGLQLNFQH